jgi:hypothetical protein
MTVNAKLLCGGVNATNALPATIAYSEDDGTTWTPSTNAGTTFGYAVAGIANNGTIWVAGGYSGGISDVVSLGYSYDGDTWIASSSGNAIFDSYVMNVAYGNGKFVAIGAGSTYSVAYSYDGINWIGCMPNNFMDGSFTIVNFEYTYTVNLTFISYINGYWIASGSAILGDLISPGNMTEIRRKLIAYSSDGINWSLANTPLNTTVNSVAYNGTNWVLVGEGENKLYHPISDIPSSYSNLYESTYYPIIYTNSPPSLWSDISWNLVNDTFGIDTGTYNIQITQDIIYSFPARLNQTNYVIGQSINIDNSGNFIIVGTRITQNGQPTDDVFTSIISKSIILKSSDGVNWTAIENVANITGTQSRLLIYNDSKWFIGQQNDNSNIAKCIAYSADAGLTWNTIAPDIFGVSAYSHCNTISLKYMYSPNPPTIINVNSNYNSLSITFTPPTYNGFGNTNIVGYKYSLDGGATYSEIMNQTTSQIVIRMPYVYTDITYTVVILAVNSNGYSSLDSNQKTVTLKKFPCFKSGSKILTNRGYKRIETLKKGDLIKTVLHGYKPVWKLGKRVIHHPACEERIKEQLYVCSSDVYPEVFEDLVITGCHSILVREWTSEEEKERTAQANGGELYITDYHYRLPACADLRTHVYEKEGDYTIYHLALENPDYYQNYGIYANGLLVESCSKRYLAELSGMEIL